MALQTIGGSLRLNSMLLDYLNPTTRVLGLAMSASAHKVAFLFQIPKSGTVAKIGFRTATVTTSDTLKVGLQTITTGNVPSGTQYGGSTPGTQAGLASNTGYTVSLAGNASVTQGDRVAVVVEFNSYVAGNLNIACIQNDAVGIGYPLCKLFSASWALQNRAPIFWLEYDDGSYAPIKGIFPFSDFVSQVYVNSSTPDEYGIKFKMPIKCRLRSVRFAGGLNASGDVTVKVYDSDGSTVMASLQLTTDNMTMSTRMLHLMFSSSPTILADTYYRVTVVNNNANNLTVDLFTLMTAAVQDMLDGGQNLHLTQRTDSGAWTDTTTKRMPIELEFDQFEVATPGGLLLHPGMSGGMRA